MNNLVIIAMGEIKESVDMASSLEDRLKAAMVQARDHWVVTDEDDMFRAAVAAILLTATDDEKIRLNAELKVLNALNAAGDGIPIDLNALDMPENPIGLLTLWRETAPLCGAK